MLLKNLTELGRQLPWPTRILQFLSNTLLDHGWWIGIIFALLLIAVASWMRTDAGQIRAARFLLRLPILGNLIRKQAIGRVSLVVASLLRSGVELVESLDIAATSCGNILVRKALQQIRIDIEKGGDLREAILAQAVFPPSVAQIFALGQQTGRLETLLERLGNDYERQTSILAGRVASVAEPVLILLLSIVVGFILFATVLPILEAGNVLAS